MDSKEYPYWGQLGPRGEIVYRPMVEIEVSNKTGAFTTMALVDSGTDSTVFHADIAKALHINPATCEKIKVGGIGQQIGFICEISVTIKDFKETLEIPAIFVEGLEFSALLGQKYFFDKFNVSFNKRRNTFRLERADKPASKGRKKSV